MSIKLSPKQASSSTTDKEKAALPSTEHSSVSTEVLRLHSLLKCLSKVHVVLGLALVILAALADFVSHRVNTFRLHGLQEICASYCILMGITGIFGSASHRRALIITFMIMGFHAIFIFTPVVIIVSSFDIHFYNRECFALCDWHLLSASVLPKKDTVGHNKTWHPDDFASSRCQILCGANIDENKRNTMTRLGTNYVLDAGLISLASLELLLSILTTIICIKEVFGLCSMKSSVDNATTNMELEPLHNNDSAVKLREA
ncbi:hypothetical protein M3Y97_00242600 [Aphelenchoides bicaudatus]|nr:hypothetical protein M3Y97_00242600 [Aphelenchoides bicaudatus]